MAVSLLYKAKMTSCTILDDEQVNLLFGTLLDSWNTLALGKIPSLSKAASFAPL